MAAERPESPDYHEEVQKFARMYSIDQWLQPRSMVHVQLAKLKEETRCPMCFGKIRQARISMVCLHRYCAKCIEQYLRAKVPGRHGDDKECPVCRAHLHSRRATKPDPAFDKIIKALYGDVDQYDAEEEALIAEDNKAHVAAWQAQLAEMKAKQAAAVAAAARGTAQTADGQEAIQPGKVERPAIEPAAPARIRLPAPKAQSGRAAGEGSAAAGALGARKRSYGDLQQRQDDMELLGYRGSASSAKVPRVGAVSDVGQQSNKLDSSRGIARQQRVGGGSFSDDAALLLSLSGRPASRQQQHGAAGTGATRASSGHLEAAKVKKEKVSSRDLAARMLGTAAHAAATAGSSAARYCLVHLQPYGRSTTQAAGAAGSSKGGRKKEQQSGAQSKQAQESAVPAVDQPYLMCPWQLTIACLKSLLVQQLRQQGAAAGVSNSNVQLVLIGQSGKVGQGKVPDSSPEAGGSSTLSDQLTIGQLYETWWGTGPELSLQYNIHRM